MTYEEFIQCKERQRKAYLLMQEVAELTETLKVIKGGDIITKIKAGGCEYILPYAAEKIFIDSLEKRVSQLNEEFMNL